MSWKGIPPSGGGHFRHNRNRVPTKAEEGEISDEEGEITSPGASSLVGVGATVAPSAAPALGGGSTGSGSGSAGASTGGFAPPPVRGIHRGGSNSKINVNNNNSNNNNATSNISSPPVPNFRNNSTTTSSGGGGGPKVSSDKMSGDPTPSKGGGPPQQQTLQSQHQHPQQQSISIHQKQQQQQQQHHTQGLPPSQQQQHQQQRPTMGNIPPPPRQRGFGTSNDRPFSSGGSPPDGGPQQQQQQQNQQPRSFSENSDGSGLSGGGGGDRGPPLPSPFRGMRGRGRGGMRGHSPIPPQRGGMGGRNSSFGSGGGDGRVRSGGGNFGGGPPPAHLNRNSSFGQQQQQQQRSGGPPDGGGGGPPPPQQQQGGGGGFGSNKRFGGEDGFGGGGGPNNKLNPEGGGGGHLRRGSFGEDGKGGGGAPPPPLQGSHRSSSFGQQRDELLGPPSGPGPPHRKTSFGNRKDALPLQHVPPFNRDGPRGGGKDWGDISSRDIGPHGGGGGNNEGGGALPPPPSHGGDKGSPPHAHGRNKPPRNFGSYSSLAEPRSSEQQQQQQPPPPFNTNSSSGRDSYYGPLGGGGGGGKDAPPGSAPGSRRPIWHNEKRRSPHSEATARRIKSFGGTPGNSGGAPPPPFVRSASGGSGGNKSDPWSQQPPSQQQQQQASPFKDSNRGGGGGDRPDFNRSSEKPFSSSSSSRPPMNDSLIPSRLDMADDHKIGSGGGDGNKFTPDFSTSSSVAVNKDGDNKFHHRTSSRSTSAPPPLTSSQLLSGPLTSSQLLAGTTSNKPRNYPDAAPKEMDPFGRTKDWRHGGGGGMIPSQQQQQHHQQQHKGPSVQHFDADKKGLPFRKNDAPHMKPVAATEIKQAPRDPRLALMAAASASAPAHVARRTSFPHTVPEKASTPTTTTAPLSNNKKVMEESKKKTPPSPLTCASLGAPAAVSRAENAVKQLSEIVSKPNMDTGLLPSKASILMAINGLDKKIKKGKENTDKVTNEVEEAQQKEAEEKALEELRLKKEQRWKKAEEEKRLEEERKAKIVLEQEQREAELKKEEDDLQAQLNIKVKAIEDRKKNADAALEERLKDLKETERKRRRKGMAGQLDDIRSEMEDEISTARAEYERARKQELKTQKKATEAEKEFKAKIKSGEIVEETTSQQSAEPQNVDIIISVLAENKRRAAKAQNESLSFIPQHYINPNDGNGDEEEDREISTAEWASRTRSVTGLANALYTEPSENPYFEAQAKKHSEIRPLVMEYVRDKKQKLRERWEQLAEEYVVRNKIYSAKHVGDHHPTHSKDKSPRNKSRRSTSIMGSKPESNASRQEVGSPTAIGGGGRSTNNPYRRARRGNNPGSTGGLGGSDIVRSEYEQEQIIAEITAKEAMEKRIAHGGSALPRQICALEKDLTVKYYNSFNSHRVFDPMAEKEEWCMKNIWSDMEKCIFLDRFLQHPKDFKKIASFLRNKSTRDCVAFYYNSKQCVPYKTALKEHLMRRKRRGDYSTWDATIQASLAVGAVVKAGANDEKPVQFFLPENDCTYFTKNLHPLKLEIFDQMEIDPNDYDADDLEEAKDGRRRKKSKSLTHCHLDETEGKFLRRTASTESISSGKRKYGSDVDSGATGEKEERTTITDLQELGLSSEVVEKSGSGRKAPQKWTAAERKLFVETVEKHGKNWPLLSAAVPTKSLSQIKNYYYDHKKQFGKQRGTGQKESSEEAKMGKRKGSSSSITGDAKSKGKQNMATDPLDSSGHRSCDPNEGSTSSTPALEPRQADMLESSQMGQRRPGMDGILGEAAHELTADAAASQGGVSSHTAADIWTQAQRAQLLKQQQHVAAEAQARRMMQSQAHINHLSSLMPWAGSSQLAQLQAQVQAQAQAAALQQQQQQQQLQQQQDPSGMGGSQEWLSQIQNALARRHSGPAHNPYLNSSHVRSMAMNMAGMTPSALNGNAMGQLEHAGLGTGSLQGMDTDQMNSLRQNLLQGFGGNVTGQDALAALQGHSQHSGPVSRSSSASSSAAAALGLLARAIPRPDSSSGGQHDQQQQQQQQQWPPS